MKSSLGFGLGRPVQRVLQGTHLIQRNLVNDKDSAAGGTSRNGTHRAPPSTSARIDEAVALPSPAVVLSARLDRYYGHLRRPPSSLPLPGFPPKPWRVPLCCLRLDGSDLLVLDRRQQPGGAMATAGVVEVVAPGRHNLSCLGLGGEPMPGQHLVFEGGEERLRGGVVEARPDASHRL